MKNERCSCGAGQLPCGSELRARLRGIKVLENLDLKPLALLIYYNTSSKQIRECTSRLLLIAVVIFLPSVES